MAFVDHLSWDKFNEGGDLPSQAAVYRKRFGCWPESIHADKVYRNRDNLKFCKERGIRLSGPPLGRPPGEPSANKAIAREDERDRIAIEGKFGQGKRRFNLGLIMSKGPATSACSIVMSFLVMNLMKWLKVIFSVLFFLLSDKMEGFGKASSGTQNRFWNDFILWMNERLKTLPAS